MKIIWFALFLACFFAYQDACAVTKVANNTSLIRKQRWVSGAPQNPASKNKSRFPFFVLTSKPGESSISELVLKAIGVIDKVVRIYVHPTRIGCTPVDDIETEHYSTVIKRHINTNYDANNNILNFMVKDILGINKVIHFSEDGLMCTTNTCNNLGNGIYAMGVCTPYYCACREGYAKENKCYDDFVYDPRNNICTAPDSISVCGA